MVIDEQRKGTTEHEAGTVAAVQSTSAITCASPMDDDAGISMEVEQEEEVAVGMNTSMPTQEELVIAVAISSTPTLSKHIRQP